MNAVDQQIQKIKKEQRMGLMTHVIVGYPSLSQTIDLVLEMEKAGADFIELQIPFSDPLADGPTIMKACEEALKNGVKVRDAFDIAEKLSGKVKVPLLFMAYYNTVFSYGAETFCRDAKKVGVSGFIIPDMPLEEEGSEYFNSYCEKYELYSIRVLSPASTKERMEKNAKVARGFVYCTARQGVTDAKKGIDPQIAEYLSEARKIFDVPLAVGFGISSKERVEMIRDYADIAVIGSAVIDVINNSGKQNIAGFIKGLGV